MRYPSTATPRLLTISLVLAVSGCTSWGGLFATVGPVYELPKKLFPLSWQTTPKPLETVGDPQAQQLEALSQFWARFNDPALLQLIEATQAASPTIAQAQARIQSAQAALVGVQAVGVPSLDATSSFNRSAFTFGGPVTRRTQTDIGLRSSWEIDLFGSVARQAESAQARAQSTTLAWHDARISVAADTGSTYYNYRQCEAQLRVLEQDTLSRERSSQLTRIAAQAGFQSDAALALIEASTADARRSLIQTRGNCDIQIKALVALSGLEEPQLKALLGSDAHLTADLPDPPPLALNTLPAQLLMKRPDLAAAERDLAAASADIGAQEANRYPRLSLNGNINPTRIAIEGGEPASVRTWSIGPSLVLPLFDRGRTAANIESAKAQYASSESVFRSKARQAVREVEEALVRVNSAEQQALHIANARVAYEKSHVYEQQKKAVGLSSELDVEQSRRLLLAAQQTILQNRLERIAARIALYRALGGDWQAPSPQAGPNNNRISS